MTAIIFYIVKNRRANGYHDMTFCNDFEMDCDNGVFCCTGKSVSSFGKSVNYAVNLLIYKKNSVKIIITLCIYIENPIKRQLQLTYKLKRKSHNHRADKGDCILIVGYGFVPMERYPGRIKTMQEYSSAQTVGLKLKKEKWK